MRYVKRKCIRCKKQFVIASSEPFKTCFKCRRPLSPASGACTRWEKQRGASVNFEVYEGPDMRGR